MPFSLDQYMNEKKKKQQQAQATTGAGQLSPTSPVTPAGSNPGGGSGFSLDDYIIRKGIASGQLQQQDNDFNTWLDSVTSFSKRMSADAAQREGVYQSDFKAYQERAGAEISDLLKRGYEAQNWYKRYGDSYDSAFQTRDGGSVSQSMLDAIAQNIKYLEDQRTRLHQEGDYWGSFADQKDYDTYKKVSGWQAIPQAADYGEKSQYQERKTEREMDVMRTFLTSLLDEQAPVVWKNSGWEDPFYAAVNGDTEARAYLRNQDNTYGSSGDALGHFMDSVIGGNQELTFMDDQERGIYNYLYATQSPKAAMEYYYYIQSGLYAKQREAEEKIAAAYAEEHPHLADIGSIVGSPLKGLSYFMQMGDYIGSGAIDENAPYNKFSYIPAAIRQKRSEDIKENWGEPGSFLYQTGMSMGDFLFQSALVGGGAGGGIGEWTALAIMGSGAAADTVLDKKSRGASDRRAFVTGTLAGLVEMATEKLGFDALFGSESLEGGMLRYILNNGKSEAAEEMTSDLANWVIDVIYDLLSGERQSDVMQGIQKYMAQGDSGAVAFGKTAADLAPEMLLDGLGGFLSGVAMAGGGSIIKSGSAVMQGSNFNVETLTDTDRSGLRQLIEGGLQSQPDTQAFKLAQQYQQKLTSTGSLSNYEIGNLMQATQRAAAFEMESLQKLTDAAEDATKGRRISNRTAGSILGDSYAIKVLTEDAGLDLKDGMTKAQQREAVRKAIRQLASRSAATGMAEAGADTTAGTGPRTEASMAHDIKSVENYVKVLGSAGAATFTSMYDPAAAVADDYVRAMTAFYNAGADGKTMAEARQRAGNVLTVQQAEAAFNAGRTDAGTVDTAAAGAYNEITKEGQTYGQETGEVRVRDGGQRADGADTGSSVQQLEGRAGQDQSGQVRGRAADRGAAGLSYGQAVSAASLGIAGGSSQADIRLVTGGDTIHTRAARALAKERGLRLTLFAGNNLNIRQADGTEASVRGYISGDRVFIRVDHSAFTADQLMRHEAGHHMIANGEINPEDVRERIMDDLGEERVSEAAGLYEEAYRGSGLSPEEIWEEIICDSLGDMNVFSGTMAEQETKEYLTATKKAANADLETRAARGPPADVSTGKTSRETAKFLRHFTGKVTGDAELDLTNMELATIASNIKSGLARIDTDATIGFVWAHNSVRECAYPFTIGRDWSVHVTDVLDPRFDGERIDFFTERTTEYGTKALRGDRQASGRQRTGQGHIDNSGRDGGQGKAVRSDEGLAGGAPAGDQAADHRPGSGNRQDGGADGAQGVTGKASREVATLRSEQMVEQKDGTARWTAERISALYDDYASTSQNYSKAYAAFISPEDFLSLTTRNLENIEAGSRSLNEAELASYSQPIYLVYDPETPGEVFGHEGRHRMVALRDAGIKRVPIVVQMMGEEGKQNRQPMAELRLIGQEFPAGRAPGRVTLTDLVPISKAYRADVEAKFGSDGSEKVRFSMELPVEETDKLMALHNLTEAQLLGCLEMGGLPMPSIAVVKAKQGHSQYGPISLVMNKGAIDPKASPLNKVYSQDAWTPTFPDVAYKVDGDKLRQFEASINELARGVAGGIFSDSSFARSMSAISSGGDFAKVTADVLAEKLAESDTVRAAYLADKGEALSSEYKTKQYGKFGNDVVQAYVDTMTAEELAKIMANILEDGETRTAAIEGQMERIRKVVGDNYRQRHESLLSHKPDGTPRTEEQITRMVDSYLDRAVTYFAAEDFIKNAWDYYSEGGAPTEIVDRMATHEKLAKAVDTKAVQEWVAGRMDGILGKRGIYNGKDIFTPNGNRRSFEALHWDVTLENVVKAMKLAGEKNATAFGHGRGVASLHAAAAKTFGSIEDIRASSDQLQIISSEKYDELMAQYGAEMRSIAEAILDSQDTKPTMTFYVNDAIDTAMEEAAAGPHTTQAIIKKFAENDLKLTKDAAKRLVQLYRNLEEMPTGYFEAKPRRAVGFDEVLAAIIPDESGEALVKALEKAGVDILTYATDDEKDRLAKVNSVEGGKFSRELRGVMEERKALLESKAVEFDLDGNIRIKDPDAISTTEWKRIIKEASGRSYFGWNTPADPTAADIAKVKAKVKGSGWYNLRQSAVLASALGLNEERTAIFQQNADKKDSDGAWLKPGQLEFFKDSVARDEYGRLQKVYHGTPRAGFTEFAKSDDIGYFFTDRDEVAASYSGTRERFDPYRLKSWEDAMEQMRYEASLVLMPDGDGYKFVGRRGDVIHYKENELGKFVKMYEREYLDESLLDEGSGIYEAYLDLKDPLIIDGHGTNWDAVIDWQEGMVTWDELTEEQQAAFLEEYGEGIEMAGTGDYGEDLPVYHPTEIYFTDHMKTRDWVREAVDMGCDGVIFRNITDTGGKGGYTGESDVYVALRPEQIKSVHNETPTGDPDMRFSREVKTLEELKEENRYLKELAKRKAEQADKWRRETTLTTPEKRTLRQKDVNRLARWLIEQADSKATQTEVKELLTDLGEYLLRGEPETQEVLSSVVWDKAVDVARVLVENAVVPDEYADLRSYLRTTKLEIAPEDYHDIPDFNDFRKSNFGRLRIGTSRTNIDTVYMELAGMWPEFFNEQEHSAPSDQLLHIVEVLDSLESANKTYSLEAEEATLYFAYLVLDGIMSEDVRQSPPTFADKQARKLERAVAKGKQAVAQERLKRQQQVQAVKDHYAEVNQRKSERAADSKARTRLLNIARRLNNKKMPVASRALLDQLIGEIDLTAKSMTGKTVRNLTELRQWVTDKTTEGSPIYDPDFTPDKETLKRLDRLERKQISSFTSQDVIALTEALLNFDANLRNAKHLIDSADRREAAIQGRDIVRNVENTTGSKKGLKDAILNGVLAPQRLLRRMTGYVDGDPLYRAGVALSDGQRAATDYEMKASKPFEKFAADKDFTRAFSGKKAEAIEITGTTKDGLATVKITPAMRASLYLHSLNNDNLLHIRDGGITVPEWKLYQKGDLAEAYARGTTIKLTPSQVRAITAGMTEMERAFARAAARYFNDVSQPSINQVSEKLKGYSIATVENYYPINVNKNYSRAQMETVLQDTSIEGMGFLKERVQARNPILLRDADLVLNQSIQQHAKYVGLAIPVRNFNKLWNVTVTTFNEDGTRSSYDGSVKDAVAQKWGEAGTDYVKKMMADLQGGTVKTPDFWGKLLAGGRSHYAGAVLTLNASVAIKQTASYPTAAAVVGWGPLMKAMGDVGKVDLDLIAKYTPLQWLRSQGYSTQELGDMASRNKRMPKALNWIQAMDLATTRKLWKASEYYVRANNSDLNVGTDAYYKAVAEVYNRVIEETQPNYTVMQRGQVLRSDNELVRALNMFKTQPFQNFNILYDAYGELAATTRRYRAGAATQEDVANARTSFARALSSQAIASFLFALMQYAWDRFRGKDKKYRDEDGEETVLAWLKGMGFNMTTNAFGMVPFGSEVYELGTSLFDQYITGLGKDAFFDSTFYGLEVSSLGAIKDTGTSLGKMMNAIGNIQNALTSGTADWKAWEGLARAVVAAGGDSAELAAGAPVGNVVNLFTAVTRNVLFATEGEYLGGYHALCITTLPGSTTWRSSAYDLLYKAKKAGDTAAYDAIYKDMTERVGIKSETIESAMKSRLKKEKGYVGQLGQMRQELTDQVKGYSTYGSMSPEMQEKVQKGIEDMTTALVLGENSGGEFDQTTAWMYWATGGGDYGVDETEAILFKVAYDMAKADKDPKTGKTVSGSKKENVLETVGQVMPWLTDEELAYLMSNYWTPEDKGLKELKEKGYK